MGDCFINTVGTTVGGCGSMSSPCGIDIGSGGKKYGQGGGGGGGGGGKIWEIGVRSG